VNAVPRVKSRTKLTNVYNISSWPFVNADSLAWCGQLFTHLSAVDILLTVNITVDNNTIQVYLQHAHVISFTYSLRWICDWVNWFWRPHQVSGGVACAGTDDDRVLLVIHFFKWQQ